MSTSLAQQQAQHGLGHTSKPGPILDATFASQAAQHVPRAFQVRLGQQCFPLQPNLSYTIGSSSEANIEVPNDPSSSRAAELAVAPLHVRLHGEQLTLLDSKGTLNGAPLRLNTPVMIRDGDVLQLGGVTMHLSQIAQPDPTGVDAAAGTLCPSHAQAQHEAQHSQAIQRSSPSNSMFLKQHVQDKEDGAGLIPGTGKNTMGVTEQTDRKSVFSIAGVAGAAAPIGAGAGASGAHKAERTVTVQEGPSGSRPAHATTIHTTGATGAGIGPGVSVKQQIVQEDERAQQPIAILPQQQQSGSTTVASTGASVMPSSSNSLSTPLLSSHLLCNLLRDMVDYKDGSLTEQADRQLPSMLLLLPLPFRQRMESSLAKQWLRLAEKEQSERILQEGTTGSGSVMGGGRVSGHRDVGGPVESHELKRLYHNPRDQLSESDLAYAMLALLTRYGDDAPVGQSMASLQAGDASAQQHSRAGSMPINSGAHSTTTSTGSHGAGLTGPTDVSPRVNQYSDAELSSIMRDMLDLAGDRVEGGHPALEFALPRMLRHLSPSYRAGFGSHQLKECILRAHQRKSERQRMLGSGTVGERDAVAHTERDRERGVFSERDRSVSSSDRILTEMDLVYALVGLQWHAQSSNSSV